MSEKEPGTRDRASFGMIASGALLALIMVVGAVVYFTRDGGSEVDNSPPPAQAAGGTGFAEPDVDLLGRRVDIPNNPAGQPLAQEPGTQRIATDPDWLTAAPVGTKKPHGWQRVYGASVPFSTSDGPTRIEDGLAVGYARTPQGAALAAAQITYRLNARPGDRDLYVTQLRVSTAQLAAYDSALSGDRLPAQQPKKVTQYFVASDAFKIDDFAEDLAIVRLASRGPVIDGKQLYAAMRMIVVWDAGDWRLKPSTTANAQTEYVESLAGWTTW